MSQRAFKNFKLGFLGGVIAFKEWDVICQALEDGRQSVILRKGGIHEGREGFSFAHEEFVLFPTRFHAQGEFVTVPGVTAKPEWEIGEEVVITSRVKVEKAVTLTDWDEVAKLADQHIWKEEVIRDRFFWEGKGMASGSIHVAYVKVEKLDEPIRFEYAKKYGGCRSWVELDVPESAPTLVCSDIWRDGGSLSATIMDGSNYKSFWLQIAPFDHPSENGHLELFCSIGQDPELKEVKIEEGSPEEAKELKFLSKVSLDEATDESREHFNQLLSVLNSRH